MMNVNEEILDQPKQIGRQRSARWVLTLCCVLIFAIYIYYQYQSSYSRLEGRGGDFIHLGYAYWVSNTPVDSTLPIGSTISSQPFEGGAIRTLVQEGPRWQIKLLDPEQTFAPDTLVYSKYSLLAPPTKGQGSGVNARKRPEYGVRYNLGVFHAARQKSTREPSFQEQHVAPPPLPPVTPVYIRAVNIHTGAIQDLTTLPARSSSQAVVGKQLYWIKFLPDDTAHIIYLDKTWMEVAGHCEVWVTSLVDKSSRRLSMDQLSIARLYAGTEGVFWAEPNSYPDRRQVLWYWQAKENRLYHITDFTGDISHSRPVEYQRRLYWFACDEPGPYNLATDYWKADRLVSANLDGTDQHVVLSLKETNCSVEFRERVYHEDAGPYLYQGDLYCLLNDLSLPDKHTSLCRLHPGSLDPVEVVYPFKKNEFFVALDEQYVYYGWHTKQHGSLWSALTGDSTDLRPRGTLSRMKLPGN